MRDRISGGNLLTGCNALRNDGINLRTSYALVSRLPIYAGPELDSIVTFANRGALTSDFSKEGDTVGARQVPRNLVHSRSSFSPNKRRRSAMERSRTLRDMAVAGKQQQTTSMDRRKQKPRSHQRKPRHPHYQVVLVCHPLFHDFQLFTVTATELLIKGV